MVNVGTKPETGPALLRSSSLCMGHVHLKDLLADQYAALIAPHLSVDTIIFDVKIIKL